MNVNITLLTTMICAARAAVDGPGARPEEAGVSMWKELASCEQAWLRTNTVPQGGAVGGRAVRSGQSLRGRCRAAHMSQRRNMWTACSRGALTMPTRLADGLGARAAPS